MIRFGIEPCNERLITDIKPLLVKHYDELTLHKDYVKLDPDWDRYQKLADAGLLVIITARDDDKLIGYSLFTVTNHLHYKTTKMANNDILFLDPAYRLGTTGIKLIKECEKVLKEMDVVKILWHIKFSKDFRKILYRLGYADEDAIVGKILKD